MTTQQNILELAKQGNPKAITALINLHLQPQGVTAKAAVKDGYLQIILESAQVPEQQALAEFVNREIRNLEIKSIKIVKVCGQQTGEEVPAWSERFELMVKKPQLFIANPSINQVKSLQPNLNQAGCVGHGLVTQISSSRCRSSAG